MRIIVGHYLPIFGILCLCTRAAVYEGFLCAWPKQTSYTIKCLQGSLINVLAIQTLQTQNLDCFKPISDLECNQRVPIQPNHIFHVQAMTRCHRQPSCTLVGTNPVRNIGMTCEANSTMRNMQVVVFECIQASGSPDRSIAAGMPISNQDRFLVTEPETTTPSERVQLTELPVHVNAGKIEGKAEESEEMPISKTFVIILGVVIFFFLLAILVVIIILYRRGVLPLKCGPSCTGLIACHEKLINCTKKKQVEKDQSVTVGTLAKSDGNKKCSCPKYACDCPPPREPTGQKILRCLKNKTTPVGEQITGAVHNLVEKIHNFRQSQAPEEEPQTPRFSKQDIIVIPNEYVPPHEHHFNTLAVEKPSKNKSVPLIGLPGKHFLKVKSMPSLFKNRNTWGGASVRSQASARSVSSFNDEDYMSDFDSEFDDDPEIYADPSQIAPRPRPKTLSEEMEYAFCKIQTRQHMPPLEEIYANFRKSKSMDSVRGDGGSAGITITIDPAGPSEKS